MWRCKPDNRWSARLSERRVLPRCLEMVDVLRTDRTYLPIVHPRTASEVHHAYLEPTNVVLAKKSCQDVRA